MTSRGRRGLIRVAAVVFAGLIVAGCSSSSSDSPTPTQASSASAAASLDLNEAPELEAMLPDTIAGEAVEKVSMRGDTLMAGGAVDASFTDFLNQLGAKPEDVAVAFAIASQADSQAFAYQVKGASPEDLLREFKGSVSANQGGSGDVTWTSADVAGKSVQKGVSTSTPKTIYLLPHGDTIFVVVTASDATATEIIAALP